MAQFKISQGDASYDVTVPEEFLNLPQDQQNAQLASAFQAHAGAAPSAAPAQAPSFKDDLTGGVHDLGTSLSQTANALGATTAGKWISDHTPDGPAANPANDVGAALKEGRYSDLPGAVAHSVVRSAPSVVPMLAAGAVPGVGPLLAGGVAGAESLGPTAYQRAQNNGRSEPDTSDVLGALPSTAVNAVAGSFLPGGAASKIASPLLRAGAKAGIEAGTGAAMEASNELGGSVGTQAGAHLDPYEMAGVGLTQGAIGAGRQIAPLAREGVKAGTDNIMSRIGDQPVSLEDAASKSRVGQAYEQHLQAVKETRGGSVRPTDVLNNMKTENLQRTQAYARLLNDTGILSDGLMNKVGAVMEQARRHNNEIVEDGLDTSSLFDDIKNSGINEDALKPLLQGIRDQNTLSKQSFLKNQTGPFEKIGNGLAQVGAVGGALMAGNIPGAIGAALGHGVVGKIGGGVGSVLDRAFGTADPTILSQRLAADRYLKRAGADAGPSTLGSLNDATSALQGIHAEQAAQQQASAEAAAKAAAAEPPPEFTVAAPAPDPVAEAAARAKAFDKLAPKPYSPPKGDPWADFEAAQADYAKKNQVYQSGAQLPGQNADPLRGVPSEAPGMPFDPQAQQALDMSAQAQAAEQARKQQGVNDLLNRIAARKVDAQSVDSLAQAKIDKFVKANAVTLAAADKLPTSDVHSVSIAGKAAMVKALDQAKAKLNMGNSATDELSDRMAVGNPAGDLMGLGDEPQRYKTVQAPRAPQPAPAPSQAPPMATPPGTAPSGPRQMPKSMVRTPHPDYPDDPTFGEFAHPIRDASGKNVGNIHGLVMDGDAQDPRQIQITGAHLDPGQASGKGLGLPAYRSVVDWALDNGYKVNSHSVVSPEAQHVYEALKRRGYDVTEGPKNNVGPDGSKVAMEGSVYTIHGKPQSAPAASGPSPALSMSTPASQGRGWETYVGKRLKPEVTRQHIYDAIDATHTPEAAEALKAEPSGVNSPRLQPVIEHLKAQGFGSETREIDKPLQWEAAKAAYQDDVARKAINAEVADSLATIGVAPGQTPTPAANDPGADPNPSKFDAGKPGNRTLGTGG